MVRKETAEKLTLLFKIVEVKLLRFQEFCNKSCVPQFWAKRPPRTCFSWEQLLRILRSFSFLASKLTSCSLKVLSNHPSQSFGNVFKMRFITSLCLLRGVGMIKPSADLTITSIWSGLASKETNQGGSFIVNTILMNEERRYKTKESEIHWKTNHFNLWHFGRHIVKMEMDKRL